MSLEALMTDDAVEVQRPETAKGISRDASGGMVQSPWTTVYDGVPVKIDPVSASRSLIYAQLSMVVTHTVYTMQDGMENGDRLKRSCGGYFVVNGIREHQAMGGMETYYVLDCEEKR